MSTVTIEKALIADAERLTEIKKKTFDEEARKWLENQVDIVDYNIQPPNYASIETAKYMIRELNYYKVLFNEEIVGENSRENRPYIYKSSIPRERNGLKSY